MRGRALLSLLLAVGGCQFDGGGLLGIGSGAADDSPLPDGAPAADGQAVTPKPDGASLPPGDHVLFAQPAGSISIDGDLGDWSSDGWLELTPPGDWVDSGEAAPSAADLSARIAARYSSASLYFALEVTDDVHANDSATADVLWDGDSVQLGFDVDQDGGSGYDTTDDWEYGWALAGDQTTYRWVAPSGAPAATNSFVVSRNSSTTVYEIEMPAADLGVDSFGSSRFGFSFIVNESDGGARVGWLELTPGIGAGKDPGQFGELRFSQ